MICIGYGPADVTATPSSLISLKSRLVNLSGAGLPRLSWKKAVKRVPCLNGFLLLFGVFTLLIGLHEWRPVHNNLCHSSLEVLVWSKWRKKLMVNWLSEVHLVEGVETEVTAVAVCWLFNTNTWLTELSCGFRVWVRIQCCGFRVGMGTIVAGIV